MAVQQQQHEVERRVKGVQAWLALWRAARAVEDQPGTASRAPACA